ncbi:MAG: UDP-2,3-diacylglucosamine diphosphatase, partial [Bacteroidales bacterium]|nr:UDP-2,3-diacylglucosamine diphosphatase [Bacteroidales bacterium]
SQKIKQKVKSAVSYVSSYENELVKLAKTRRVDGIICGHIHQPANREIDGIHYLNSGDWVETMSALLEHEDGSWEVYRHNEKMEMPEPEYRMQPGINIVHPEAVTLRVAFSDSFSNNFFNHLF